MRLSRTRGEMLWMRAHFDGRLRAEIRAGDAGGWVVLVRGGDEPMREARVPADPAAARRTADEILLAQFPHECGSEECGEWVALGTPKK